MSRSSAYDGDHPTVFSKSTLIPFGLVLTFMTFGAWVGSLQNRLTQIEDRTDRMTNRLELQSDQLNRISQQTSGIDAKLSGFIDFYRERAISPRK